MKHLATLIALLFATVLNAQDTDETRPIARTDPSGTIADTWYTIPMGIQAEAMSRRSDQLSPEDRDALAAGSVCGDIQIQGERLDTHPGSGACGVKDAVRLRSVAGVALSVPAIIDCTTARALRRWVETGVKPIVGNEGGGVASLRVVAHYACRTRNNQAGARLSEHASGRAIDIAGIGLRNGDEITVLTCWNTPDDGQKLRRMWQAACGPFGTVLGPEADRFHLDHFHFDTAQYRSGTYCR